MVGIIKVGFVAAVAAAVGFVAGDVTFAMAAVILASLAVEGK